jgi:hypothetical protein
MKQGCSKSAEIQGDYGELTVFRTDSAEYYEASITAVTSNPVSIEPEIHSPFHAEVKLARLPRLGMFMVRTSAIRVRARESNAPMRGWQASVTGNSSSTWRAAKASRIWGFAWGSRRG